MTDDEMPVSGSYALYRGRRHRVLFGGDGYVGVADPGADHGDWPDALGFGDRRGEAWVKLPRTAVEAFVVVRVEAEWKGESVTVVRRLQDGRLDLSYVGAPDRARAMGMTGDQYQGWYGVAEPGELTLTTVTEEVRGDG